MKLSYVQANQSAKTIELEASTYLFERDLDSGPIEMNAEIMGDACGGVDFSSPTWSGTITGASGKVK